MKNKYIEELKETKVLQEEGYTFKEYITQLQELQRLIVNVIYQEDIPLNDVHLDEAISELGKLCRENKIDPNLTSSVKGALKSIHKELAINMSGINAENFISNKIDEAKRDKMINFRNVYLTDGKNETEIDNVVLTDEGIIIFEVKSSSGKVTIDKDGRLLRDGHNCYDKMPIVDSMALKRNLLGKKIDELLAKNHLYVPDLYIESYITFYSSRDRRIEVTDNSGLEEYCFSSEVPEIIEKPIDSGFKYNNYEFEALRKVINEIGHDMAIKTNKINAEHIIELTVSVLEMIYLTNEEVTEEPLNKNSKFNWWKMFRNTFASLAMVEVSAAILAMFHSKKSW